jgi:hypothetical protein
MHKCLFYRGNINCSYFLPLVEISVDDLNGGDKTCDIFLTSLIFSLTVWMTLDTISRVNYNYADRMRAHILHFVRVEKDYKTPS